MPRTLHYNGAFFTSLTLAYVTKSLRGIWGSGADESWAVGLLGNALRKSGSRWLGIAATEMLAADLNAITGRSANDVWVAGASGVVLQWNGVAFVPKSGPLAVGAFTDTVNAIAAIGTGATDIVVAGNGGTIARYAGTGTSWNRMITASTDVYNGVWGSNTNLWVVGNGGVILHWQGTAFVADPQSKLVTTQNLRAIWGSGPSDVWAVGDAGTILRYNGSKWQSIAGGGALNLYGLWGSGTGDIWAVGQNGSIYHWDGQSWTRRPEQVTAHDLYGVWGSSDSDVTFVGASGTILRYSK